MLKFTIKIPELDKLPEDRQKELLEHCLKSPEFARRTRRARIYSFIVFLVLLLGPPWFFTAPLAKTTLQGILFTALAILGLLIAIFVVPFFTDPKILRQLIREKLRNDVTAFSSR